MVKQGSITELQPVELKNWSDSRCVSSSLTLFEKFEASSQFSIKLVTKGEEKYHVGGSTYKLKQGEFLIVNQGEKIETLVKSKKETNGICIYPSSTLLEEVFNGYGKSVEEQLNFNSKEDLAYLTTSSYHLNSLNSTSNFLNNNIHLLHNYAASNPDWWEEFYLDLAECLVHDQTQLNQKLDQVQSIKKQTKEELFRRVSKARDFIHDNRTEQLNLEILCQLSSLSKFHFLRSFKAIFKQTPYQYLLQLKLDEARKLIAQGYSYEEASNTIGFSGGRNLRKAVKRAEA